MPLDLHVLGLSLAFILSQDQTLRSNITLNLKTFVIPRSFSQKPPWQPWRPGIDPGINTRHLSNFYCIQYFKDRSSVEQERIQPHPLSRFADAKVGTFSHPPNFSNTFFWKIFKELDFQENSITISRRPSLCYQNFKLRTLSLKRRMQRYGKFLNQQAKNTVFWKYFFANTANYHHINILQNTTG